MSAILQEIRHIKSDRRQLRSFGLLFAILILGFAAYQYYIGDLILVWVGLIGIVLTMIALVYPYPLKPVYLVWMILAVVLGYVMSRVILTLLFYLVITPIGLIARLFGHRFMALGPDGEEKTYWRRRDPIDPKSIEKQF